MNHGAAGLTHFDRIVVNTSREVRIEIGPAYGATYEGQPPGPSTVDSTLEIHDDAGTGGLVTIQVPHLARLTHAGAGAVQVRGVAQRRIQLLARGEGMLLVSGRVSLLVAELAGEGDVDMAGLNAAHGHLINNGSGQMTASVRNMVRVDRGDGGRVRLLPTA